MISVDVAPAVTATLRRMRDRGDQPSRCHDGVIRSAIGGLVSRLLGDDLDGAVRPWDLAELRRRADGLGEVTGAQAVLVDTDVLVAQLIPGGERLVFRGVDAGWRLVRFADGDDVGLRPESARQVPLHGDGPDAVLAALNIAKPDGIELEFSTEDLGQGETESRYGYRWTDAHGRTILAEEIKNEIFDGATPSSRYLHGVVIDGDGGMILSGRGDSALLIEG